MSALGAATTVMAPMLLQASSFTRFALLNSVFTYLSEFDFGLSRLADRQLPQATDDVTGLMGRLLAARYAIAALLALLVIAIGPLIDPLMVLTGLGGVGFLIGNGPLSFYRARSQTALFTMTALLMQFALTLPRLGGLALDGVRGCIIGLALWSIAVGVIVNLRFLPTVPRPDWRSTLQVIGRGVPLFLYGALWLLYLYANRWLSWSMSSAADAGLFAFGANLTVVAVAMVTTLSQPFYPRHLVLLDPNRLTHEMLMLFVGGVVGCLSGIAFCRYGLTLVFPHFADAAAPTSALIFSGLPLGLGAWLVPLVVARSGRLCDTLVFPLCLLFMAGLMTALNRRHGIVGQAWACVPPAMLLFGVQLAMVTRARFLRLRVALMIWVLCGCAEMLGIALWWITF